MNHRCSPIHSTTPTQLTVEVVAPLELAVATEELNARPTVREPVAQLFERTRIQLLSATTLAMLCGRRGRVQPAGPMVMAEGVQAVTVLTALAVVAAVAAAEAAATGAVRSLCCHLDVVRRRWRPRLLP